MKKRNTLISGFAALLLVCSTGLLLAQNQPAPATSTAADGTSTEAGTTTESKSALEAGVGQVKWGSNFETVKGAIKGTLKHYTLNKVIVSKDGEITYTYGFFYMDPEVLEELANAQNGTTATEAESAQPAATTAVAANGEAAAVETGSTQSSESGPLFSYVVMDFPYLELEEIKKKYVDKYGEPSKESIVENRGVLIWEDENTMIALWVDEYEGAAYCRKINYLSKTVVEKLDNYYYLIFNKKEIETLQKIEP